VYADNRIISDYLQQKPMETQVGMAARKSANFSNFVKLGLGMWSRSRDGLETHQRLVSVSSRLFTSRAQDVILVRVDLHCC